jgi:hypothetical protein
MPQMMTLVQVVAAGGYRFPGSGQGREGIRADGKAELDIAAS